MRADHLDDAAPLGLPHQVLQAAAILAIAVLLFLAELHRVFLG